MVAPGIRQCIETGVIYRLYVMSQRNCRTWALGQSLTFIMFVLHFSELEASRTAADAQAAKQAQLEKQLEAALLDKKRLQDLDSGKS